MANLVLSRDLFGKPIRQRRPKYEAALERLDRITLVERAARVRWLAQKIPHNILMAMPFETMTVLQEAKSSFISGQFVATIVLASAFVEHWFTSNLNNLGFNKEANQGLAAAIVCARKNDLAPSFLLDMADNLRKIRNPFAHLKSFDHEFNPSRRARKMGAHAYELLERDAQNSIILIYAIGIHTFKQR